MLATFETAGAHILAAQAPTRYAVRQVLDQELHKALTMRENTARQSRFRAGGSLGGHEDYRFNDKENQGPRKFQDKGNKLVAATATKRDFFGRVIEVPRPLQEADGNAGDRRRRNGEGATKVWVTFHEGLNNAVRKPISLEEFLRGL